MTSNLDNNTRFNRVFFGSTQIQALVFDFDGVLTDNRVWVHSDGKESVVCSRSDGMAITFLRQLSVDLHILSSEHDPVVQMRASKMKIECISASDDKRKDLLKLSAEHDVDLKHTMYVGNDVNDLGPVGICGFSACPADAFVGVKEVVDLVLATNGGCGVVRELVENHFSYE